MLKKTNKFIILMIMVLMISSIFAPYSLADTIQYQFNNNISFDHFNYNDLENYPDVKEFMIKNGYDPNLINDKILSFDKRQALKISKEYGLIEEESHELNKDNFILVKKERSTDERYIIKNVIIVGVKPNDSNLKVSVTNIGFDPVDHISGVIKKYDLNRKDWKYDQKKNFSKRQVNSGDVFTWSIKKDKVAEKFKYEISVTENGKTYKYDNLDEDSCIRYNFEAGIYNKMEAKGGERHHVVSKDALMKAGFNADKAPVIRMIYDDHTKTPNWGNRTSAKKFRDEELKLLKAKKYEKLLQMEVDALKKTKDPEGKYSSLAKKYESELLVALNLLEEYFDIDD